MVVIPPLRCEYPGCDRPHRGSPVTLHPRYDGSTRWVWLCRNHAQLLHVGEADVVRYVYAETLPIEVPDAPPLAWQPFR